jgi:two-component system sensor histidine kinase/response regulator
MQDTCVALKKRILIVDDEYSIREALEMLFTGKGYSVRVAVNGEDALGIVEKEDFDIIVSDIRMDRLDGVGLIKKLKDDAREIPVVFITAFPELDNAVEAIRNGVVEYIKKPFDMDFIAGKVDAIIEEKRATSEAGLKRRFKDEKEKFLNRLSHELRTPLTPVAGYLKLLLKKEFGEISPQQLPILMDMARNSDRLKTVIDDLIMLYAVEQAEVPLSLRKYSLAGIINDALLAEETEIKRRRISFDLRFYDDVDEIFCDEKKMRRVIWHLADNAVRYGPDHSVVEITARKFSYDSRMFTKVSVADRGDFIEKKERRGIFNCFYRMNGGSDDDNVNSAIKGIGLGLTLSKAIVEAHGGKIWIDEPDAEQKSGNIFSFIIPIL